MQSRRQFIKKSITAAMGGSALLSSCTKLKQRPNIIFILADDMGYGDLGCYGQKLIKTPNIDKMANEGIKFTQHYAGNTVCAPSRCNLMTGMHPGNAFVRGNRQAEPYGQLPIPKNTVTIASLLKSAGYKTGCFGKWGLGIENTTGDPQKHGFDEFYGYYDQVLAHNSFPEFLFDNGQKQMLKNKVTYVPKEHWSKGLGSYSTEKVEYSNDLIFAKSLSFIEKSKDNPFFVYLPVTMPHDNGEGPEGEKMEAPDVGLYELENWSGDEKRYAAMISRLDEYVGKLVTHLKENNLDENTIIFFSSDNGATWHLDRFNSNKPLRGYKRDLYEGGIRVPMIVRWPGKVAANSTTDHISAFWDFMPTACDLAGIETPKDIDGISFTPTLLNKGQTQHEFLYWEFHWWLEPRQAVRLGDWKGILFNEIEDKAEHFELYNLKSDLEEKNNLAEQHPEIVEKIKQIMIKAHTPSSHFKLK